MKDILLRAYELCVMEYCKNDPSIFRRFKHVWDEKFTVEQKILELSKALTNLGYEIKKVRKTKTK